MEIPEIKEKILEAQGFDQEILKFYKKFFDNFDCNFSYEMRGLCLNVKLPKEAKSIDEVAEQLEEKKIILGNEIKSKAGRIYKVYENNYYLGIKNPDEEKDKQFYQLKPHNLSRITNIFIK